MLELSAASKLKAGVCVQITGHRLQDVLLIESVPSNNKFSGMLLSTGEKVTLIFVENKYSVAHLRKSSGEVNHLEMMGAPLPDETVNGIITSEQRRFNANAKSAETLAKAFRRNCTRFQRKRAKLAQGSPSA